MTIQEQNIVFVESQVMDDVPEGGGAATGRVIIDGKMNNVFPDTSDLDWALGRFNLRKLFLAVRTLSRDLYGGAKTVITGLPENPALGYTLFTTNDPFDRRTNAANRVEAYLFKGPMWPGALFENHIAGMQAINVLQRVGTALPPIGKTLTLVQNEGQGNEIEQYVRVISVDVVEATFTDMNGDFQRWVVTMGLSDPLLHNFTGHQPSRTDAYNYTTGARLRDTRVADAQRYFGSQRLAAPASIGDTQIQAQSQFTQLVPSARSETPLVNQPLNPQLIQTISAGARSVQVPQQAHTLALQVTAENRRLNWIQTVAPAPAANTLTVSFMTQGNWYTLRDNGNGTISGADPADGAGTVNYVTGSVSVTLGALPDAGSQVMLIWASPVHYQALAGHADIDPRLVIEFDLEEPIEPGTLELEWLQGGTTRTATSNAGGEISGHATGFVSHVVGRGWIRLTVPPDSASLLGVKYQRRTAVQQTFTGVSAAGGLATVSVGQAVEPGSVEVRWSTDSTVRQDRTTRQIWRTWNSSSGFQTHTDKRSQNSSSETTRFDFIATDNGQGEIVSSSGVVNYSTGQIVVPVLPAVSQRSWDSWARSWEESESQNQAFTSGVIDVTFTPAGAGATAVETTIPMPALQVRLMPRLLDAFMVPGSVEFLWNGQTYRDFNGVLRRQNDTIVAGSVDYLSGTVTLTDFVSGAGAIQITSLLGRFGDWLATEASFRALTSPLAPEGLQIIAVAADGEQLTANADQNGQINSAWIKGEVNYEFGIARIEFGQVGPDPENPGGPEIWIPREVDPGTITYNAIAFRFVPLPANIVGINAVRLPADGRVPIYRAGDIVMVMHAVENAPATPAQDGGSGPYLLPLGRTRIAWVRITDANGDPVTEGYQLDRANGVLSWGSLDGLATPVTVRHTVADMRLVIDAQISGALTLSRGLSHNFPAEETIVGSCLLHGDRRARVSATWDQQSWNNTWVDNIVGSPATATLNFIDFPIELTNEGTDTDRWLLRVVNSSTNQWELISENRGLVWVGTYAPGGDDIAPINPRTRTFDENSQTFVGGTPYMRIPAAANGGGWANGNVVRINTVGAIQDIWIARSIQQADAPEDDGIDGVEIHALGNVNNPVGE